MEKFFDYFDGRYRESVLNKPPADDGPVITLSRLTGCDARQVASVMAEGLNKRYNTNKWRWVDKDIIYAIATELNTDALRVENFYKGIELSNLSEMIMAFSGGFVSVVLAREISNALHIRLVAPFYWRVENVMRKKSMDMERAEEYIVDTDEKRFNLIQSFLDKKPLNLDYLFDATLNRGSFTIPEIADMILLMYDRKVCKLISERKKVTGVI
jgi:cytidylate kinase